MKIAIKGFEDLYSIDDQGNVFSHYRNKFLKPLPDTHGYLQVCLKKDKKAYWKRIHRLVAIAFIPNPESKPEVNHKDGDKHRNQVDNLEWVTDSEQTKHAYDNGLAHSWLKGKRSNRAKLTEEQVQEIKNLYPAIPVKELAFRYGIHKTCIYKILKGVSYK